MCNTDSAFSLAEQMKVAFDRVEDMLAFAEYPGMRLFVNDTACSVPVHQDCYTLSIGNEYLTICVTCNEGNMCYQLEKMEQIVPDNPSDPIAYYMADRGTYATVKDVLQAVLHCICEDAVNLVLGDTQK